MFEFIRNLMMIRDIRGRRFFFFFLEEKCSKFYGKGKKFVILFLVIRVLLLSVERKMVVFLFEMIISDLFNFFFVFNLNNNRVVFYR